MTAVLEIGNGSRLALDLRTTQGPTLPSFTGATKPVFSAPGGISVQIPEGDFKTQITNLSSQPGMGYLNDLAAREDVNWQPVKLAFEQWNYKQEGLTPAGAALLAAAVAWAMPAGGNELGQLQFQDDQSHKKVALRSSSKVLAALTD